jgi:hypothetical protein
MVTNNFGNRNFMQPMGRRLNMHSKCLDSFSFKFGGYIFSFSLVPNMFPMGFLGSGRFLMCSPKVFPLAPSFNPICFAQSPPLLTYIGGPKGESLHLSIESSILWSIGDMKDVRCDVGCKM